MIALSPSSEPADWARPSLEDASNHREGKSPNVVHIASPAQQCPRHSQCSALRNRNKPNLSVGTLGQLTIRPCLAVKNARGCILESFVLAPTISLAAFGSPGLFPRNQKELLAALALENSANQCACLLRVGVHKQPA
jgi:hypothetical protein